MRSADIPKPLISVIVPIYGVEKYLDRCVESIIAQTYENLEIILVDDGSPDKCPEMCDDWAKKDARIRAIHKPNGGLSDARNAGIKIAKGDYISFIDSDDWVDRDFIGELYTAIYENDCDLSECEFIRTPSVIERPYTEKEFKVYNNEETVEANLKGFPFVDMVWCKLYKKSIVTELFEKGKWHEDVMWTYRILANCKRAVHINTKLYFYFLNENSYMLSDFSESRLSVIEAISVKCDFMRNNYPRFLPTAQRNLFGMSLYIGQKLISSSIKNKRALLKNICRVLENCGEEWKTSSETDFKAHVWNNMLLKAPMLTCKIRNILKIGL